MIQANDAAFDFIYSTLLDDDIKKEVSFFEKFLERRETFKNNSIFNIIIEDMSRRKMQSLLEYLNHILKEKGMTDDIKTIYHLNEISDFEDSVLLLQIDEISDFQREWCNSSNDMVRAFKDSFFHNNILIVTALKPLQAYKVIEESDIIRIAPAFRFHENKDLDYSYQSLLNHFKEENIDCHLSREDFQMIFDSIKENDYVIYFDIDEYLYQYATNSNKFYQENIVTVDTYSDLLDEEKEDEKKETKEININDLTGLMDVKRELKSLFHYASFIKNMNIDKNSTYLNMFFLGNPGTGKTMVANVIAEKLYKLGYLESSEVIKIVPNDLIGEYVGHTKKVVRSILNKAKGKLLFIDEAYLMGQKSYSKGRNPFMEEALVELLKYLEDSKNIVIFAGYKDEMRELYNTNPGLKSRIYKEIIFKDYSSSELYKILEQDLKTKGLSIDRSAKPSLTKYICELKNSKDFGNARSMLQLSQKLIMNHANHCRKENKYIIDEDDLPKDEIQSSSRMGFDVYDRRTFIK